MSIVEEDVLIVKIVAAGGVQFTIEHLFSIDSMPSIYPSIYGSPYFLNKDDFGAFYAHWLDSYSEYPFLIDCSAEKRVFTYSSLYPNSSHNIGSSHVDSGIPDTIYDFGDENKIYRSEYTRDGVLNYQRIENIFKGIISEEYSLDILSLKDVKSTNNISIIPIFCSLVTVSTVFLIIKRRRISR